MKKKSDDLQNEKNNLKFLIETVKNVACDFDERSPELVSWLKDYLTEDIATEWEDNIVEGHLKFLKNFEDADKKMSRLVELISSRFLAASQGSIHEEAIWTLEGLQSHPFWEEQRRLAKELLVELEKITIN